MRSIAGNDNRVSRLYALFEAYCYFRKELYPNRSVRDTLGILLF